MLKLKRFSMVNQ